MTPEESGSPKLKRMFRSFRLRVRALFQRRRLEQDLEDELAFHLEMRRANAPARGHFGNVTRIRETTRGLWTFRFIEEAQSDCRYAIRGLVRSPSFAAVAIVTLALGIGANTAIFQVLDTVVLRPLPVREPRELVKVQGYHGENGQRFSYPLLREMIARQTTVEGIFASGAIGIRDFAIAGRPASERVSAWLATRNYFTLIGTEAQLGRLFSDIDDDPAQPPVAVISDRFWRREFGGGPDAIGQAVQVNGVTATIVGITARGFYGERVDDPADLWLPISFAGQVGSPGRLTASTIWLEPMARMRTGISLERAQAELGLFWDQMRDLSLQFRGITDYSLELLPAYRGLGTLHVQYARSLWLLMGLVGLVTLVACSNLANLLLARAAGRAREISVRLAIGASRRRVVRQLLTESLVIALAGGLAGLGIAAFVSRALVSLAAAGEPWGLSTRVDWGVAAFTLGVTLVAAGVFGLVPALTATRSSLNATLQGSSRAVIGGRGRQKASSAFVVAQVAVSVLLVAGSFMLVRTFWNLVWQDYGFDPDNVVIAQLVSDRGVIDAETRDAAARQVRDAPGVVSAALTGSGMLTQWPSFGPAPVSVPGRSLPESLGFRVIPVSPGFLETLSIPLRRGRSITEDDAAGPRVAVVSDTAARLLFGETDAIGRVFGSGSEFSPETAMEVVGVLGDLKLYSLRDAFVPVAFVPFAQAPPTGYPPTVVARVSGDPGRSIRMLEQVIREVRPDLRVDAGAALADLVRISVRQERLLAWLAGGFGLLATVLACGGLYGVASYSAEGRTQEIGVRIALGARRGVIQRKMTSELLAVVSVGIVVGSLATLAASRFVEGLLFGLAPNDPITITAASALLLGVAALASYLPARRASRIDPMAALRCE